MIHLTKRSKLQELTFIASELMPVMKIDTCYLKKEG